MSIDPRTGAYTLPDGDPRRADEDARTRAHLDREMQNPCNCPVNPGPHAHAPYAQPAGDGSFVGG